MDLTHLHLLLNHFPILGTLFGLCLLSYGLFRKNKSLENAGLISLTIIALIAIPTFLTGEEAEETVEHLSNVSEYYIEEHEELAETAIWLMAATGVMALISFAASFNKPDQKRFLKAITLFLAIGTFAVMTVVGNYGGKIRHSELRDEAQQQSIQIDTQAEHQEDGEEDD